MAVFNQQFRTIWGQYKEKAHFAGLLQNAPSILPEMFPTALNTALPNYVPTLGRKRCALSSLAQQLFVFGTNLGQAAAIDP
jgi:hypothetical protein